MLRIYANHTCNSAVPVWLSYYRQRGVGVHASAGCKTHQYITIVVNSMYPEWPCNLKILIFFIFVIVCRVRVLSLRLFRKGVRQWHIRITKMHNIRERAIHSPVRYSTQHFRIMNMSYVLLPRMIRRAVLLFFMYTRIYRSFRKDALHTCTYTQCIVRARCNIFGKNGDSNGYAL